MIAMWRQHARHRNVDEAGALAERARHRRLGVTPSAARSAHQRHESGEAQGARSFIGASSPPGGGS